MSTRRSTARPGAPGRAARAGRIARVGPAIGLAALAGAATLAACADGSAGAPTGPTAPTPAPSPAPSAAPQGNLSVLLTDDPFPFDSVARADIYVVRIDARRAEPDSATAERGKDDDHKPGESEHEGEHHGGAGSGNPGASGSGSSGSDGSSDTTHHEGGGGSSSDTSHHGGAHPSRGVLSFAAARARNPRRVSAIRGGSPRRDAAATAAADSDEWVTIAAPNARMNLLDLQRGKTAALGQQGLPVGTYRGFRIVIDVDSSSVTLKSGVVLTAASRPGIRFPSAGRSGIKVTLDHPVTVADTGARLVFDFDLGRSFVLHGTSPGAAGFELKPVVRATLPGLTGTLTGTVRDSASAVAVRGATIELLQAGTPASDTTREHVVATAAADDRGTYAAAFLPPGRYALRVTGRSSRSARATRFVPEVEVKTGAEPAHQDVVLP